MTTRFNGYNKLARLGYFMGDNGLVSVAVEGVKVAATGVVAPVNEYKRMYARVPDADIGSLVFWDKVDEAWVDTANVNTEAGVKNVPAETLEEDFGVAFADDDAYIQAWARQTNLKRIVDAIQQRAVILAASKVVTGDVATADGWNVALTGADVVTFLVERATVFDKLRPNQYGQPSATASVKGAELVSDLIGLPLLADDGAVVKLTATNSSVKVDTSLPAMLK